MSYDSLKNGISNNLQALGYQESQYSNIEAIPTSEYGNAFILNALSGENDEDTSETLSSLFYDIQKWEIIILFEKSSENQNINYDVVNRAKDAIIKRVDNPSNWESYARIQKYKNWKIEDSPNYYKLTIELKVIDTITYA